MSRAMPRFIPDPRIWNQYQFCARLGMCAVVELIGDLAVPPEGQPVLLLGAPPAPNYIDGER